MHVLHKILQYCRIQPCIYVVICPNISHFVGVLLHLFISSILFAHSFPTVGSQSPRCAHTSPPWAHMVAPPTSLSLVNPQVRWFYRLFSLVPTVGTSWAHNGINTDAQPFSGEHYLDSQTDNTKPVLEPKANFFFLRNFFFIIIIVLVFHRYLVDNLQWLGLGDMLYAVRLQKVHITIV